MRCYICDSPLTSKSIQWNSKFKQFDPCFQCLNVINDLLGIKLITEDEFYELDTETKQLLETISEPVG